MARKNDAGAPGRTLSGVDYRFERKENPVGNVDIHANIVLVMSES